MWIFRLALTVSIPVSKATSWLGQAPERSVGPDTRRRNCPARLDVADQQHFPGRERSGVQAAEHTAAPAVVQHIHAKTCWPTRAAASPDARSAPLLDTNLGT